MEHEVRYFIFSIPHLNVLILSWT